jgi:hypothetical protein
MKKTIFLSYLLIQTFAFSQENLMIKGCQDMLSETRSFESTLALGYVSGVKDTGLITLEQLGYPTVTGVNPKEACRVFLLTLRKPKANQYDPQILFNVLIKGLLVRNNGYSWDEVQKKVKAAQSCIGVGSKKNKKKY